MFVLFEQNQKLKILIIEDEQELAETIDTYLSANGYSCERAHSFATALNKTEENTFDCILLDIGLPDGNGLELLKWLKEDKKEDGVIIISAKDSLDDKIAGLNIGADDYLSKPFHLSELNARIFSVIRRKHFDGSSLIKINELDIDLQNKTVKVKGSLIELTKKEFELLLYFVANKNRLLSRDAIAEHLWQFDMGGNYDFIYTHIKNLRKKLVEAGCEDIIKSVYGMGYKLVTE